MKYLLIYFIAVSFLSLFVFSLDKYRAERKHQRVSEKSLHILELLGGIFVILPLMYIIRHKNKKKSYFLVSYAIFLVWAVVVIFIYK